MNNTHILVIEDELICVGFIEHILKNQGCKVTVAHSCNAAWQLLEQDASPFEAILLDRGLPDMDGLLFLKRLKADPKLQNIPVILETASSDETSIRAGLSAGAYYYLTKPLNADLLVSIVSAAIEQCRNDNALKALVKQNKPAFCQHLDEAVLHYRTLDEAKCLAQALSQLFAEPDRVVVGLQELLINAVEHGNLGISYADKTRLVLESKWLEEITRRQNLPELQARQVEIRFQKLPDRIVLTIQDQGSGFDWQKYLQMAPERAFDPNGRGIAMAKMLSFDSLTFLGNGNTVQVTIEK